MRMGIGSVGLSNVDGMIQGVQMRYLPWEFNQLLVNAVRQEIKVNFLFSSLFCLCSIARLHLIVLVLFIVARIGVLCIISKGCSIRKTSLTNRVNQENSSSSCNRS